MGKSPAEAISVKDMNLKNIINLIKAEMIKFFNKYIHFSFHNNSKS